MGSALVPRLIETGHDVTVVDTLWFGRALPPQIPLLHKDVLDVTASDLEGVDQIIHLAGVSNDPMAAFAPRENFVGNAAAPAYLGYMAKQVGVKRFVLASSCSVYGDAPLVSCDESSPAKCTFPYGLAKLQAEDALFKLADKTFSVIALRKGTICGVSPRMRLDLIVNTMVMCALRDWRIVVNNPTIWRPILSMADAAEAYLCAVAIDPGFSGIFNITSGNYTVGDVAFQVQQRTEELSGHAIAVETKDLEELRNYRVDTSRAQRELGFRPRDTLASMVDELYQTLSVGFDFDDPNYYNIRVFKQLADRAEVAVI